jgi:hypothetical protein
MTWKCARSDKQTALGNDGRRTRYRSLRTRRALGDAGSDRRERSDRSDRQRHQRKETPWCALEVNKHIHGQFDLKSEG